jgi:hypothetical protein
MVREALRHALARKRDSVDVADFLWGPDGGVRVRRHWNASLSLSGEAL